MVPEPISTSILLGAAGVAAVKALENVVDSLYGKLSIALKKSYPRAKIDVSKLYMQLARVRSVKTIWQTDREVNLQEFYHPTRIIRDGKTKSVKTLNDISRKSHILLEGIVGQGKSIFLRYLTSQELISATHIPLFIELRRATESTSLQSLVLDALLDAGLPGDPAFFDYCAKSGLLILFLDAFDELPEAATLSVVTSLEGWARRFPKMRIVVTSRPNSPLSASAHFRVFQLAPLTERELPGIVNRLTDGSIVAKNLLEAINGNRSEVRGVLTTPLMVTLLIITYKSSNAVPETLSEFYQQLLPVLLTRHDRSKPGFARPRKCKLADTPLRRVFEGLCFKSKQKQRTAFSTKEAADYVSAAAKLRSIDVDPDAFVEDLVKITCLLLEEADVISFVHKSVQEFGAATFVSDMEEAWAQEFYKKMNEGLWPHWQVELSFLRDLDSIRFAKHFVLRDLEKAIARLFRVPYRPGLRPNGDAIKRLLRPLGIYVVGGSFVGWSFQKMDTEWCVSGHHGGASQIGFRLVGPCLGGEAEEAIKEKCLSSGKTSRSSERQNISMVTVFEAGVLPEESKNAAVEMLVSLVASYEAALHRVTSFEAEAARVMLEM